MCGRYVSVASRADLLELFRATGAGDGKELAPSWNVAPTTKVYAVVERARRDAGAVREVRAVRWGLFPDYGAPPHTHSKRTVSPPHLLDPRLRATR